MKCKLIHKGKHCGNVMPDFLKKKDKKKGCVFKEMGLDKWD